MAGDSFLWVGGASGAWNDPANWEDTTTNTFPAGPPGGNDTPSISGAVVTGSGAANTVLLDNGVTLAGSFTVGSVGVTGTDKISGGSVAAGSGVSITNATLNVASGGFLYTSGLSFPAGFSPNAGRNTATLSVSDAMSGIEVGSGGSLVAGELLIDPGASISVAGSFFIRNGNDGTFGAFVTLSAPTLVNNDSFTVSGNLTLTSQSTLTNNGEMDLQPGSSITSNNPANNLSNRSSGAGTLTTSAAQFVNNGTIAILAPVPTSVGNGFTTSGFAGTVDISGTQIVNNGLLDVQDQGRLRLDAGAGGIIGTGAIDLGNSTQFFGNFGPSTGNTIVITGTSATITIAIASSNNAISGPVIVGFDPTDTLAISGGAPITGATFTPQSANSGLLNLVNSAQTVATLRLVGDYGGATFKVTPASNGERVITLAAASTTPTFDQTWGLVGDRDYNGDGFADLAWQQQSTKAVELQLLQGTTTIQRSEIQNSPFDASWSVVGTGDFNGDGVGDFVYRRASDGLTEIQLLNGNTAIGGGAIANNPFDASWNLVGIGDFNGDGKSDLVWQRASDGLAEIELLNASSGPGGAVTIVGGGVIANNPFGAGWNVVATGDFNGDGKADLVWQNPSLGGLVEIQFLNGNTAIGGGTIAGSPFGPGWNVVGAGDFLGNGHTDLVYQRQSDDLVEIQYLNGNTAIGGGAIANSPFGPGWAVIGVGDFNHDGKADLVYRNASTGVTEVQFLNGTTPIGGGIVSFG